MLATYHNHTTFSDGKADLETLIAHARSIEVDELGVADHLTLHPAGDIPKWSMQPGDLPEYVNAVSAAAQRNDDICLRLGIELDWFDGHDAALRDVVDAHPFDFILGSVHFVGEFPVDGNPHRWGGLSQNEIDDIHSGYWARVRTMAESGLFDVAAHLDLPKKFGYRPREEPWALIDAALDAIAEARMVVEVNTAGWHKACGDAYPSVEILRACHDRGIATTISADAHRPEHLTRDFDRAAARLREVGYESVARFHQRTVTFDPLEQAAARG